MRLALVLWVSASALCFLFSPAVAQIPAPASCSVGSGIINACPYDHPFGTTDAERYQDIIVTLRDASGTAVPGYPASDFQFDVKPHSGYPTLGGAPGGTCPNCEHRFWVSCRNPVTNALGEMVVRVSLDPTCSPSMTCPVEIDVVLWNIGCIPTPIEILQNSHDLVPNGDVRAADYGAFAAAFTQYAQSGILTPAADFVWAIGQIAWGEITAPDFGAFSNHYKDCCGLIKEGNPGNCDPWSDPCGMGLAP